MKARKRNGKKKKPSLKMAAQAIAKTVYKSFVELPEEERESDIARFGTRNVKEVKAAESKEMNKTIDELHEMSGAVSSSRTDAFAVKARRSPLMTLAVYCFYFGMLLM